MPKAKRAPPGTDDAASPNAGDAAGALAAESLPQQNQARVMEMLEYIKGLGIDPVKEEALLWIAEEAFHAALPPGWSEHKDDQGHMYFHNVTTNESTWMHPMDEIYREIVGYQRQAVADGGFWCIEDQLAEQEESIRAENADWMELFDERGEKFFHNQRTTESRYDDPRLPVYHCLMAKIKMIAKMKERLPRLASAPRLSEPSKQGEQSQRQQQRVDQRTLDAIIRIQKMTRGWLARRRVQKIRAQAVIQKGPQPLKGQLRLRIERTGPEGAHELVLSQTTPHRREKAAKKIQARSRGVAARKQHRPLVEHRAHLNRVATDPELGQGLSRKATSTALASGVGRRSGRQYAAGFQGLQRQAVYQRVAR
jgi:hypothetical protein